MGKSLLIISLALATLGLTSFWAIYTLREALSGLDRKRLSDAPAATDVDDDSDGNKTTS